MAEPTSFTEATRTLVAPVDWDNADRGPCGDLPVYTDGEQLISCWRLSWRERVAALVGGRVWLRVVGAGHPPVAVEATSPWLVKRSLVGAIARRLPALRGRRVAPAP